MKYAFFNRFEIKLPDDAVTDCSHQGACDSDVAFWVNRVDFSGIDPEDIRAELEEQGAWDDEELADDDQNRHRILWIAACNIKEGFYEDAE